MKLRSNFFGPILVLACTALGCGNSGDGQEESVDGSTGSAGTTEVCEASITEMDAEENQLITLKDSQNYSFKASQTIQTVNVKSMSDLVFDWSGLTRDIRRRELDPLADIDMIELVLWQNITEEELKEDMSTDSVDLKYIVGLVLLQTNNAVTSAQLFDLQPPAADFTHDQLLTYVNTDLYPPENHVYSVMLAQGATLGQGTLMMTFIRPDPNETNTQVNITDDSTRLEYTIDMTSMERIVLPAGTASITFSWSDNTALTKNAIGNDFLPTKITEIMVGHYLTMTPTDLEDQFLDIDSIADGLWTAYLSAGTSAKLSQLENAEGEALTGIDKTGTWIIALMCGSCSSPAPWFLSVLEACP